MTYTADTAGGDARLTVGELPLSHLRIAIIDLLLSSPQPALAAIQDQLWREPPDRVALHYSEACIAIAENREQDGPRGLRAELMRKLHRPLRTEPRNRRGITITDVAKSVGIDREVACSLLAHHGYIETAFYGGHQRRRLLTKAAIVAGIGQNIDPSLRRAARLDGHAKTAPFAVFWPEFVDAVVWTFDLDRIREHAASIPARRKRAVWLCENHGYFPAKFLAQVCGYSERGWGKAAARIKATAVADVLPMAA